MSASASLTLVIGGTVAIAALLILFTRRPSRSSVPEPQPEPLTMRLRPTGEQLAHRFYVAELRATGLPDLVPLAACGRWPADALVRDDAASPCVPCEREAERVERGNE